MRLAITQVAFTAALAELNRLGVAATGDSGTLSHSGVTVEYSYADSMLDITVIHKPFFVSESYVEGQITNWFAQPKPATPVIGAFKGAVQAMVALVLFSAAMLLPCGVAHAQGVANLYMGGGSYSAGATPAFATSALYAHQIIAPSDSFIGGTYMFTMIDAVPNTLKPFTVTTDVAVGIAQKVVTIAGYAVMVPTAAGISYTGTNTGWAWSTGVGVPVPLPTKSGNWYVMPTVRVLKSSVSSGTGYQPIVGLLFGWGQ